MNDDTSNRSRPGPDGTSAPGQNPAKGGLPGTDHLKDTARAAGDAVKEELRAAKEEVMEEGRAALQKAEGEAREFADQQRAVAAEKVSAIARALRAGARELAQADQPEFADYSKQAAAGIDDLADWIAHKPLQEVWREAEAYARRQPMIAFGGALTAGFLLARFLKSSSAATGAAAARDHAVQARPGYTQTSGMSDASSPSGNGAASPYTSVQGG